MPRTSNPQSKIENPTSNAVAVIPARYDSVRFPGKMLADRTGKPLVQHVYERATQAKLVNRVLIATDDDRVARAVKAFGGETVMTRRDHPNGTSRIAEVAAMLEAPIIVNVQGDEPEMEPQNIDLAIQTLIKHSECPVATVASPFDAGEDQSNANVVKVVLDAAGRALYFSRAAIPHDRDRVGVNRLKHIGLYVYRREFLAQYVKLPPTPLEKAEQLEQLRILENGFSIAVGIGQSRSQGIDTPEQYEAFVQRVSRKPSAVEI